MRLDREVGDHREAVALVSTTRSAVAASTSPQPTRCSRRTLVEASGSFGRRAGSRTSGAPGSSAAATVKTAGSSSYSTRTRRAASSAASRLSAATAATGSPWYLVSPTAMTGRSWNCGPKRGVGCGRSAADTISRTPGTRRRRSCRSTRSGRGRRAGPRGWHGARPPGGCRRRSAAVPVDPVLAADARAGPISPIRAGAHRSAASAVAQDRLGDLLVAAAPAEVAGQALVDLVNASDARRARAGRARPSPGPGCRSRIGRRPSRGRLPAMGSAGRRRPALRSS